MFRGITSSYGSLKGSVFRYYVIRGAASTTAGISKLRNVKDLPGPLSVPVFGSAPGMVLDKDFDSSRLHKYWFSAHKKYGDIFFIDSFGIKVVCISDPDDMQKVFQITKDNPIRVTSAALLKVRLEESDNYFEGKGGVSMEQGEEWWRVRRRTQGPMMKPKIVKHYLNAHNEVTLEFLDVIKDLQDKHGEMPADFQNEIYKWALESVGLVALDRRLGCLQPGLSKDSMQWELINSANIMFQAMSDCEIGLRLWRFFPTKSYKQLKEAHSVFVKVADQGIRQTVEDLKGKKPGQEATLMQLFLQTPGLSYKDVVTMVLDMLFAGIDTTSYTMAFALYLLAKNPEKQKILQAEIDSIIGDSTDLTASQIGQLSYVKLVVKETMRIFPIGVGTIRTLTEDVEIKGYKIPEGYGALNMNLVSSRSEKYFPRPLEFIPERWGRDRPFGEIHPFASLPFGTGTRMCIGRRIAEQEMYTFLVRVMQRYTVEYKYKDMDIRTKLLFMPSEPLKFNFIERKSSKN